MELPEIPVVDAHCHVSLRWFEPGESLLYELDRCGVERAIITGNLWEFDEVEDSYQRRFFHAHEDRFASVAIVDPERPGASDLLRRYVDDGCTGVRLFAEARSPGEDPFEIWRTAEELGIAVTTLSRGGGLADDAFLDVLTAVPTLRMALEHGAGVTGPGSTDAQREKAWRLARFPQLFIKIDPISNIAERDLPYPSMYPFKLPLPPYLETIYEMWGPERMMWGSDFPPVAAREGYANALRYPREELAHKPLEAQRQIFGGTALKVFWGSR